MRVLLSIIVVFLIAVSSALAQGVGRELKIVTGQTVEVVNRFGRVDIVSQATTAPEAEGDKAVEVPGTLSVISRGELSESEITTIGAKGNLRIEVSPDSLSKRVDLKLALPERTKLILETKDGGILVEGNFASINATTDTGTIAVDVPTENLKYDLNWTMSKPRYLADFEIEEVQERSGGRFQIKGVVGQKTKKTKKRVKAAPARKKKRVVAKKSAPKKSAKKAKAKAAPKAAAPKKAAAAKKPPAPKPAPAPAPSMPSYGSESSSSPPSSGGGSEGGSSS